MLKYPVGILTMIVFLFTAAGCDNYSILDQFSRGGPLSIAIQKSTLQQGEAVALYPSGGLPPYTFGVVAGSLYVSGTSIGSVSGATYTAGDAIGTVEITVTDTAGNNANTLATIVPPAPGNFGVVANTSTHTITLSWTYSDTSIISGFQIWRSVAGGSFSLLATAPSTSTSYADPGLNQNKIYTYRMYALAGSYLSSPTPDQSAQP